MGEEYFWLYFHTKCNPLVMLLINVYLSDIAKKCIYLRYPMTILKPVFSFCILILFSSNVFAIERVSFSSSGNINLEGFFYYPEKIDNAKSLIIVIGGSGHTSGGFGGPSKASSLFANNGHISFEWNKRGIKSNEELTDINIDNSIYETATIDNIFLDASAALNFAHNLYPNLPVFVLGGSEGSIVTTLLAENYPHLITAAASFGTVVNSFIDTMFFQASDGINKSLFSYDADNDERISKDEFNSALAGWRKFQDLVSDANMSFDKIDFFKDGYIERNEIERMVTNHSLLTSGYMMESSGLPDSYLRSMYSILPLYNRIQNIEIPFSFFHGTSDWNTPVDKVMQLELITKALNLDNFNFHYYTGLGHAPSSQMFINILEFFESF